jgi:hypothetical protein
VECVLGDGITETFTSGGTITHTYSLAGDYTIRVALVDEDGQHDGTGLLAVSVAAAPLRPQRPQRR